MAFAERIQRDVLLAPLTTLELGGPAREFVEATDEPTLRDAAAYARDARIPLLPIGQGSNLVVADRGFAGLVVRVANRGIAVRRAGERVLVEAAAGEPWDGLVARAVQEGLAGIECLSGIPGLVGATPIQNVGAYGQEVSDTIVSVRALDRETLEIGERPAATCGFSYRSSEFKRDPTGRHVIVAVTFALVPGGEPTLRYGELAHALRERGLGRPSLADVRTAVIEIRRRKSMVLLDPADPNRRTAGSFFLNPVVSPPERDRAVARAIAAGIMRHAGEMPQYPTPAGAVKLAAGWLIEKAGIARGVRHGAVGVSTRHALALVHHGGGTAREILALADRIAAKVEQAFGIRLEREPACVGF